MELMETILSHKLLHLLQLDHLNLPISFPNTTGCKKPNSGGELIEN